MCAWWTNPQKRHTVHEGNIADLDDTSLLPHTCQQAKGQTVPSAGKGVWQQELWFCAGGAEEGCSYFVREFLQN